MAARHGRTARTPVSPADPGVLASPDPVTTVSAAATGGGRDRASRTELLRLADGLLEEPSVRRAWLQRASAGRVLDWLEEFPGESWQDRWLLAGDGQGPGCGPRLDVPLHRRQFSTGLGVLIVLRAVRPGYGWQFGSRLLGVYEQYRRHNQTATFAELRRLASARGGCAEHETEALNALTRMVIVTGKDLRDLDAADIAGYVAARRATGRVVASVPLAYELLHAVGGLPGAPPTLRQARARGQLTAAELVDRYPIANRAVRDVLVHYLAERAAVLDYGSLVHQSQMLVDLFWVDLERHHPGIASLHLPDPVAHGWKQRIRTRPDGQPRRNVHAVLLTVRAFYLDLLQWSLADPARWAAWAAPCPIGEADVRGYIKEARRRQARMQERTRTLAPVLPRLVAAAGLQLDRAGRLLAATRAASPGEEFTVDGTRYRRTGRPKGSWRPTALFVQLVDGSGRRFDAECEEDNAFWCWAIVEVLRRTGARVEELLELTHLSLRQYQAPTGEMVPLLQISPSKTDRERVIPADPELVAVLARIIRRVKGPDGRVPLLTRYDGHERLFGPPLPHLFQRVSQHRLQVISSDRVRQLLSRLAGRADIIDVDGTPLRFTPQDLLHRDRQRRPADPHRRQTSRPPRPEHYSGLRRRLSQRGYPPLPAVRRTTPYPTAQRRIP